MRGWWLLLLLSSPTSFSSRCLNRNEDEEHHTQLDALVVATGSGRVVGARKEAVDPRQNVTVSWTAFYVGLMLVSLVVQFSPGSSICCSTSWPASLSPTATSSILGMPEVDQ